MPNPTIFEYLESDGCEELERILARQDDNFTKQINQPNAAGETPLHVAARMNADMVKLLLVNGAKASVEQVNSVGRTPLHCAIFESRSPDAVRALLNELGVDLQTPLQAGELPPLEMALNEKNNRALDNLIDLGVFSIESLDGLIQQDKAAMFLTAAEKLRVFEASPNKHFSYHLSISTSIFDHQAEACFKACFAKYPKFFDAFDSVRAAKAGWCEDKSPADFGLRAGSKGVGMFARNKVAASVVNLAIDSAVSDAAAQLSARRAAPE